MYVGILDPVKGGTHGSQSSQVPAFGNSEVLCVSILAFIGADLTQNQLQNLGEIVFKKSKYLKSNNKIKKQIKS